MHAEKSAVERDRREEGERLGGQAGFGAERSRCRKKPCEYPHFFFFFSQQYNIPIGCPLKDKQRLGDLGNDARLMREKVAVAKLCGGQTGCTEVDPMIPIRIGKFIELCKDQNFNL